MRYHEHYCIEKLHFVLRLVSILRVQYQIQELVSCIACQALVTGNWPSFLGIEVRFTHREWHNRTEGGVFAA